MEVKKKKECYAVSKMIIRYGKGVNMKLLLVDDEKLFLETVKEYINWNEMGVPEIETAYSVAQTKQCLEQKDIDIVISDIEMPDENGMELMKWLQDYDQRVIKMLVSCHEEFSDVVEAMHYGVFNYLVKPIDLQELQRVMKEAVIRLTKYDMRSYF